MTIFGIQRIQAVVGTIRLGRRETDAKGRTRPVALDTFRLTSPREDLITAAAEHFGGTVAPWQTPQGDRHWEVITDAAELPIGVPPQDLAATQWMEKWDGGGLVRRCDGRRQTNGRPCQCDPDNRECRPHTRLRVMIEPLRGVGAWKVGSTGYFAAAELPAVIDLLSKTGDFLPAKLILDRRTTVTDGITHRFAVPVVDTDFTPAELMSGNIAVLAARRRAAALPAEVEPAALEGDHVDSYTALIGTAPTRAALETILERAKAAGHDSQRLRDRLNARAAQLKAPPTVEGEVVDHTAAAADDA